MKKSILHIWTLVLFLGSLISVQAQVIGDITIANKGKTAYNNEVIEIGADKLKGFNFSEPVKLVTSPGNVEIPYQFIIRNDKLMVLLVQTSIDAGKKIKLRIIKGTPARVGAKTFARYVPERKDDFAWENDKVAFRMYGKALESFPSEMAVGVDFWAKKTDKLIIDKWYKMDDYHTDHGEGLDYYSVGMSLGAGGNAPFYNDSIYHSKNYTDWKVLDNGPLRTTFQLTYPSWKVGNSMVTVVKTISIDAGSQLNKAVINYTTDNKAPLQVAAGVVISKTGGKTFTNNTDVVSYWENEVPGKGQTGVGCVFVNRAQFMGVKKNHVLGVFDVKSGADFTYYHGAAWDKAGKITTDGQWQQYLHDFSYKLKHLPKITVKKK